MARGSHGNVQGRRVTGRDTWGQVGVGQIVQPRWQFFECCHLFTEGTFDSTLSLIQGMVAHLRCLGDDMHLL